MQKLNDFMKEKLNQLGLKIHQMKAEGTKKKTIKGFKKTCRKLFKRDTIVKIILVIATASLLLPLLSPFFG